MKSEELLKNLNSLMAEKGIASERQKSRTELLRESGLQSMAATKNILQDIYSYQPPTGSGVLRKLKNKIIGVIRNVTVSTVELFVIKQNKFNELTYQHMQMLLEENQELREEIAKLKGERS